MHSLQTKIIILVLCCTLLSTGAVGSASIFQSKQAVLEDSTHIMNLLCENRAHQINTLFSTIEQSVMTLYSYAQNKLDNASRLSSDSVYLEEYVQSLEEVAVNAARNTSGAMTVFFRLNPDISYGTAGFYYIRESIQSSFHKLTPTDISQYDPSDTAHVGWYYDTIKNQSPTWLLPYYNPAIDTEIISYIIPFYADDTLIGIIGMDIDSSFISDISLNTSLYDTGYSFATDKAANIIYHNTLSRGINLQEYSNGEFNDFAQLLCTQDNNGSDLILYTYEGIPKKAAFQKLNNNMLLIVTAPQAEIDARAENLFFQLLFYLLFFITLAIGITIIFARRLIRPLQELNVAAKQIAAGDLSVSITHQSKDEVGTLAESFRQTAAHLNKYISSISELAYRDSLTGVKNKRAYTEFTANLDKISNPLYVVIVFDINDLKTVNDTFGHDLGDIMISDACRIICNNFKKSPVFRIGGDEFTVIAENSEYNNYPTHLYMLDETIRQYNSSAENAIPISIAYGSAIFDKELDTAYADVFKRADTTMYRNKELMKQKHIIQ